MQARAVAARLDSIGVAVELVTITTSGDRLQQAPLSDPGGKQLFVKEIDDALLAGAIDLAVHSAKDMPATLPDGIDVAAVLPREDPRDALVLPGLDRTVPLTDAMSRLDGAPTIGTGSVRRAAQLAALLPHAVFAPIRGNVDTRLRKLAEGDWAATVLAAAGLRRLGVTLTHAVPLDPETFVPAVGQGILAIEARADDRATLSVLARADDGPSHACACAERPYLARLGASCHTPMAAHARLEGGTVRMTAVVAAEDGRRVLRAAGAAAVERAEALGRELAEQLLARGAAEVTALHPAPGGR